MVAEGSRYKTSSSGRGPSSGNYRSASHLDLSSSTSHLPGASSSAPVFGRIRITQSVERDFRSGGLGGGGVGGPYTGGGLSTAAAGTHPSHGRRFSLSTDRILTRDKAAQHTTSTSGLKPLHHHHPPTPYLQRRASIASSTLRPKNAFANHHLLATDDDDDDDDAAGSHNQNTTYSYRPYAPVTAGSVGASSTVSSRGTSVRASSVSKYDSQNSLHGGRTQTESSSLYEGSYNGRSPSVSRYESHTTSFVRSPSVSRYDGPISNGRAPSLSRYENHTPRAPSISRYDSLSSLTRAPSVSRYDGYGSTPRAPSVSRYEGYSSTPRAPSVSRYEGYGSTPRAPSVSRYEGFSSTPRAPSVSRYEGYSSTPRAPSVSQYEGYSSTPRPPSVPRYESQSSVARASSVSRYEVYGSTPRAPSVSRYESQGSIARAPSVSRYESQGSIARAPSVSQYEVHGSTPRAPSVSRYEGYSSTSRAPSVSRYESQPPPVKHRFRSASVSRYERSTRFAASDAADDPYLDHPTGTTVRAVSTSRSSEHLVDGTSTSTGDGDDESGYQLRRQLRAMRNQQVRGGSVARHEISGRQSVDPHVVVTHHHEAPIRPRSLSISSAQQHHQRRYKVLTVQSPVKVPSPSSATLHTGYPEPTLYSAKVFHTHDVAHANVEGTHVTAINSESAFIDNREDITSFVLKPGEKFLPTDVSVHMLPSGKKAVTYTQFSQKGHGDQRSANEQIERIISKTKLLQETMHTLEDFVKRNRSLFPEDIIIYQKIVFYLLSEAELIKMGERPDAEIYGVKIRERLVAPMGTDVASILKRYYSRHTEVEVEYEHVDVIRRQLEQSEMEAAASGKRPTPSPRRARHFQDELDFEKQQPGGYQPQSWHPARRSRSSELFIDEEELLRREGMAKSPRRGQQRPSAPEFTHRLRGQRAAVGQSVRLSCTVSAFPEPVITWYRGKQEITQNGRFSVKQNNYSGLCTLTISDLTPEDGVLYTVKAANSEGETATSGLLEVYDLPESSSAYPAQRQAGQTGPLRRRSTEPLGTAGAAGRRPFFLLEARNLWADVGEKAVFEVQAAGKPLPSFTWVKDDVPLTAEDDHIHMESDGYGNCKLVIREIRESDFGTYRCLAQNEDGLIESIASLFCVGNESLRPGQAIRDELLSSAGQHRGRKPTFVFAPPSRIDVIEGEPLTLQCTVDGDPKPLITWYKGVRELTYTGRHRVLEERNSCYVMQLKSTLATDSGEYTVTAHNLCGLAESIVYVNVLPAERALDDFDPNWKRLDLTPLDYELVTKTRQGKMPPIFVKKLPREKQFKVGGSLKFDCLIEVTKPREYLVDVDIVLKGEKKDDTVPRRTETKYERKILLDAVKPQQQRTSPVDIGVQERSRSKENVPTAKPSAFNVKTDDSVESIQPSHADRGIVQLAENLARQISNEAVEATLQQQQQQQQQQQEQQHDSIIHQRNAGHELKTEDQEEIRSRGNYEVSEESESKTDDKATEIKTEDTPTEIKVEDTPTEIKVEETPTEIKVEETPTEIKVEETPTEIKVEETPTEIKVEETPTEIKVEETPTEIKVEETPTVIKVEETPTEIKVEDTPTKIKVEETPTEIKVEETPTETKAEDTPTETKAEDTPTETKSEVTPTETKAEDTAPQTEATPTESKSPDVSTITPTEEEEEKPVVVVKVAESGAGVESTETVLKAEATPAAAAAAVAAAAATAAAAVAAVAAAVAATAPTTAELGTEDVKDHEEEEEEEEEESSESVLSSSESESESD